MDFRVERESIGGSKFKLKPQPKATSENLKNHKRSVDLNDIELPERMKRANFFIKK